MAYELDSQRILVSVYDPYVSDDAGFEATIDDADFVALAVTHEDFEGVE